MEQQHRYARLLMFMLMVCRDHANVTMFGVEQVDKVVVEEAPTASSPPSAIQRMFAGKHKGGKSHS